MKIKDGSDVRRGLTNCSTDFEKGGRCDRDGGREGEHNSEQSCGTEQSPASAKGAEQNTVRVVCSLGFLWRSLHYRIHAKGRVKTDRHVVLKFS